MHVKTVNFMIIYSPRDNPVADLCIAVEQNKSRSVQILSHKSRNLG